MLVETRPVPAALRWKASAARHWPEYFIEGACLGLFMVSASFFGTLLGHPASPVVRWIQNPTVLRIMMGAAMGTTAIALIYSPFGKRSGAHMNPATTLTFWRLGKIAGADAASYAISQFLGGALGMVLAAGILGSLLSSPSVNYVVTLPGVYGNAWAFVAEIVITFVLMSVILRVSNRPGLNRYTGLFAGLLVMIYISIEAPISGMSMNPARSLGSALSAGNWMSLWIYFTAPPLGMLLAAEAYVRRYGIASVLCAKLHHENQERCIFNCNYPAARRAESL